MDDLVRWLGDQLTEDERIARAAEASKEDGWRWGPDSESAAERHIAEWGPARVLREIDAKRDLLVFAKGIHDHHATFTTGVYARLEQVLRLYALAYKGRPGYAEAIGEGESDG